MIDVINRALSRRIEGCLIAVPAVEIRRSVQLVEHDRESRYLIVKDLVRAGHERARAWDAAGTPSPVMRAGG